MGLGFGPILVVQSECARRIRKRQTHLEPAGGDQRRFDPHRHFIAAGMHRRFDPDRRALHFKTTGQDPAPEIEFLFDVPQVFDGDFRSVGLRHFQSDPAQAEPMRVGPQVSGIGRRGGGAAGRIHHLVVVFLDRDELELVEAVAVGVGKTVPAPGAEDADWRRLFVVLGKGLQTGDVGIEREFAVADGQRAHRVDLPNHDVVAADQRVPVNPPAGGGGLRRAGRRETDHQTKCGP